MGRPPEPLEKLTPPNFEKRTEELRNAILKFFGKEENKTMEISKGMAKILHQILLNPFSEYVYHICKYPKKPYQQSFSYLVYQGMILECLKHRTMDYGRPERKLHSLSGQKFTPTPKFLGTAEAYFVCHLGPIFQISLIYAFIGCP